MKTEAYCKCTDECPLHGERADRLAKKKKRAEAAAMELLEALEVIHTASGHQFCTSVMGHTFECRQREALIKEIELD